MGLELNILGQRRFGDAKQVEQGDNADQRSILEQADELPDDSRDHNADGLREDDQHSDQRGTQAQRFSRFDLPARNSLKATANILSQISGAEHRDARHRADDRIDLPASQEKRHQHLGHKQHGDQRYAANDFDIDNAQQLNNRQIAAATQRQQHAERKRGADPNDAQDNGEQAGAGIDSRPSTRQEATVMSLDELYNWQ